VFKGIAKAWIQKKVQKWEVRIHEFASPSSCPFIPTIFFAYLQVAATVRAMREELPIVPTAILEIAGQYMESCDWQEAGTRLVI
jgi:hypothetical protein